MTLIQRITAASGALCGRGGESEPEGLAVARAETEPEEESCEVGSGPTGN
jgi:hypothetical protein